MLDTHTAVWNWGDGSTSAGTVSETNGSGSISGSHAYSKPGVYKLTLTVTDKDGASAQTIFESVLVYNPNGGSATGSGWINSPAGAFIANPSLKGKAPFDFDVKYKRGASIPTGHVNFKLPSNALDFHSTGLDWMIINTKPGLLCWWFDQCSSTIQIKGTGTTKAGGNYQFMVWATDNHPDTLRIKIWSVNSAGVETVLYDNLSQQPIGGGNIDVAR